MKKKIQKKISIKESINNFNSDNDILISRVNQQQNMESNKSLTSVRINIDKKKLNIIKNYDNNNENQNRNNKNKSYFNNNNSTDNIISQKTKADIINKEYQSKNKLNIVKEDKNGKRENNDEIIDIKLKNSNFNFCDYLKENIKCCKKKKNIELYNNFRAKILSEEYFFHNNLNIQLLLKLNENNLMNIKDKFLLTDLVNIV